MVRGSATAMNQAAHAIIVHVSKDDINVVSHGFLGLLVTDIKSFARVPTSFTAYLLSQRDVFATKLS